MTPREEFIEDLTDLDGETIINGIEHLYSEFDYYRCRLFEDTSKIQNVGFTLEYLPKQKRIRLVVYDT